jgi:hypothetical protein
MLMALVLLAAIEAAPSSTVSLTPTGETDRPPVSATRRSLSDVARELRAGRRAIGGFSAVASTVPQSRNVFVPMFEPEPDTREAEPEVAPETSPVYLPSYLPTVYGGSRRIGHLHRLTALHAFSLRPGSLPLSRPTGPFMAQPRQTMAGSVRQR